LLVPERLQRYLLSDLNPAMWPVKMLAEMVRAQRRPASPDNPFVQAERQMSDAIEKSLDTYRDMRDAWSERLFKAIYESPWLAAMVGLAGKTDPRQAPKPAAKLREEFMRLKVHELEGQLEEGMPLDGWVRILLYQGRDEKVVDERPFNLVRQFIQEMPVKKRPTLAQLKEAIKRQSFILLLDEERAVKALPKLLPDVEERQRALARARQIATARAGKLSAAQEARFRRLEEVLGVAGSNE
jgi:hypothetical protein